jgi:ElaB/YqjD/DUF883 family membrane-anchored ribosome-binding protein
MMEDAFNDLNGEIHEEGRRLHRAAREGARRGRERANDEVSRLVADVEELVRRVADAADPELTRLRANVEATLATTKAAIAEGTEGVRRQAREALARGDDLVRERPWEAIGVAALAGVAIGFLLGRR